MRIKSKIHDFLTRLETANPKEEEMFLFFFNVRKANIFLDLLYNSNICVICYLFDFILLSKYYEINYIF